MDIGSKEFHANRVRQESFDDCESETRSALSAGSSMRVSRVAPIDWFEMGELIVVTSGARNLFVLQAAFRPIISIVQQKRDLGLQDLPGCFDLSTRRAVLTSLVESGACVFD